ncbi:hypothetical protein ACFFJY_01815 [Fictibacillus aquaticus]|uniref:Uncharacterized protein n=1 Tax=Fictibacillus aquaticus TaxID=2021314 RepID=A0A235F8C3_9BACL|nr:hypothetical protein [Fictibacillus aquaticus]OYD57449.1 hypothetical protein CGZ90_12285 [Fictibacillus aquaticus]
MDFWWIAYGLIVLFSVIGLGGTIYIAGTRDEKYGSSTKQNLTRLTLIYAVVILLSIIALTVYVVI